MNIFIEPVREKIREAQESKFVGIIVPSDEVRIVCEAILHDACKDPDFEDWTIAQPHGNGFVSAMAFESGGVVQVITRQAYENTKDEGLFVSLLVINDEDLVARETATGGPVIKHIAFS